MNAPSLPSARKRAVVAWLVGVALFAVLVGVWGVTLGGIVAVRAPAAVATPEATFGAQRVLVSGPVDVSSAGSSRSCVYTQSDQGMLIVLSATTGSILSPAQAANCSK